MTRACIPTKFWDEIFSSAVYLINRLPSSNSKIPYTSLFHKPPDYNFLRILGCLCFPLTRPYNANKLEVRALPCVFLGYTLSQKGYKCLHLPTNRLYISRQVQFDESTFPFSADTKAQDFSSDFFNTGLPLLPVGSLNRSAPLFSSAGPPATSSTSAQFQPTAESLSPSAQLPLPADPSADRPSVPPAHHSEPHPDRGSLADRSAPSSSSSPLSDASAIPCLVDTTESSHPMVTRTRDCTRRPKQFPDFVALSSSRDSEPTTFRQANSVPEWRTAMATEITALAQNCTWTLVPPSPEQHVIGCKWVFKIKRDANGVIQRYKARLVAKGYNQEEGLDYQETFSHVVRPTTIRIVLTIALSRRWLIKQLDVQNAFLHGDLKETVFMTQPPGFVDPSKPNHVCRLSKSLYGLKQSPRAWFHKLSEALLSFGFHSSSYDPSLFIAHRHGSTTIILVYVDDIILTASHPDAITACITFLQSQFALKDLGSLHYFLGIEVVPTAHGLHLSQQHYITGILQRAKMVEAKPCSTPISTSLHLSHFDGNTFEDPQLYRSIVGALQYATITRPDISFAVNKVSQYMHSPKVPHWIAVKRILRYLNGSLTHGLLFQPSSSLIMHAYSDADWAGCVDDRKSTSGFCIFLGSNLISWSAKKQQTVSRSSTEAEYRSLAITCAEIMWIKYLLAELLGSYDTPPILWCDNIGATFLASNPMFHARTKHIEIDYHFIREQVCSNNLLVRYVCSTDQLADSFTKPLSTTRFEQLRSKLMVQTPT